MEAAYAALAERLNGSDGDYIFGAKPSSLDALLYGHLAFHQAAPISSPEIQHQVGSHDICFFGLHNFYDSTHAHAAAPHPSDLFWCNFLITDKHHSNMKCGLALLAAGAVSGVERVCRQDIKGQF